MRTFRIFTLFVSCLSLLLSARGGHVAETLSLSAGWNAVYLESFGAIEDYILTNCVNGDLLITMGAGDIYKVGDDLLGR